LGVGLTTPHRKKKFLTVCLTGPLSGSMEKKLIKLKENSFMLKTRKILTEIINFENTI
jgi:hypothetical protein